MGRYRKSGGINDTLEDLKYLIRQLDGIRAFRRTDPAPLAEKMKYYGFGDLYGRIGPDIERIVFLPNQLPVIRSLVQVTGALRSLFMVCLFSILLAVLMRAGIFPVVRPWIYRLFLYIPSVILVGFAVLDFLLRRLIAGYEKKHPNLHNDEKERLRDAVGRLIPRLYRELRERNVSPEDFPMVLYHNDYPGIRIVKSRNERVLVLFRKKYLTYVGVISGKGKS
ncbi:MAG: hypothetical protein JW760_09360 [Spirochaetales bacterium]|nr:hypothetical protein [Spirochaetales bacterium]